MQVRVLPGGHFLAANAKQIERPVFQAGPNGCESRRGYQFIPEQVRSCDQSDQPPSQL